MALPLQIDLNERQRTELEDLRDHSKLPYLRERAAAILKIADGHSGRETARTLLNRAHWQDTIYDWVKRYQVQGVEDPQWERPEACFFSLSIQTVRQRKKRLRTLFTSDRSSLAYNRRAGR